MKNEKKKRSRVFFHFLFLILTLFFYIDVGDALGGAQLKMTYPANNDILMHRLYVYFIFTSTPSIFPSKSLCIIHDEQSKTKNNNVQARSAEFQGMHFRACKSTQQHARHANAPSRMSRHARM